MRFRALDDNSDWTFGRGLSDYISAISATLLNVKTRLQEWVGDCFFAMDAGIDWANRLGFRGQLFTLKQELVQRILASEGVLSIDKLDVTYSTGSRRVIADYTINTIYSQNTSDAAIVEVANA